MISKQAKDFIDSIDTPGRVLDINLAAIPNTISSEEVNSYMSNREDIQRLNNLALKLKAELATKNIKKSSKLGNAIEVLCNELKDENYYRSWKDNIAMAFKDEFVRQRNDSEESSEDIHLIANNAADNFLKQLMK